MVANPNAPFGFKHIGRKDGSVPNFGLRTGMIITGNLNKIFTGDVLAPNSSGYLDVASVVGGGAAIGGIAMWFEWISKSQNKTVRQNWWPGNGDASGDVTVYYHADAQDLFLVQALLGPITQASVGLNANWDVGAGGQQIGAGNQSSSTLALLNTTSTLPFKIYNLPVKGPLAAQYSTAGFDASQAYNQVIVEFNNLTS